MNSIDSSINSDVVTAAACYLCGSTAFALRPGEVRDDPSLRILECRRCGLVALDRRDHIGPGHYETDAMHPGESIETWAREAQPDDERRFEALRTLATNRRVLDFGSGAGGFLRSAERVAAAVAGVEPERRVRDAHTAAWPLYGSLDDVDGVFDLITAFHVVEHLPDPRDTLRRLAVFLATGGRLVVEVPSADDALLTLYECSAFQRFTYWSHHLFLFNAATLRELASQAGLYVVAIEQVQRYGLANHTFWLSRGRPGGHQQWGFLDTPELRAAYADALASIGRCDTIVAHLEMRR